MLTPSIRLAAYEVVCSHFIADVYFLLSAGSNFGRKQPCCHSLVVGKGVQAKQDIVQLSQRSEDCRRTHCCIMQCKHQKFATVSSNVNMLRSYSLDRLSSKVCGCCQGLCFWDMCIQQMYGMQPFLLYGHMSSDSNDPAEMSNAFHCVT